MSKPCVQRLVPMVVLLCATQAQAQTCESCELEQLFSLSVEELLEVPVEVGSRGDTRQWQYSPVPVDVVTAYELQRSGYIDLNQILLHTLAYFNFQQLTIRDGSDHSRPFALRGMSPDQVLVLVNGKRYHPGALTHLSTALGKGSNHVDLGFFPIDAIERIEILKDGAAAQYGSDAIAGIINIVLAKYVPDQLKLTGGSTYSGDGAYWSLSGRHHFEFGDAGFVQMTAGLTDYDKTIRAGADNRQQYFDGDPRNDNPALNHQVNMESGDPNRRDLQLTLNGGATLAGKSVYGFANINHRVSDAAGFFRRALDNRTLRSRYPDGYLPRIEAKIDDLSMTLGLSDTTDGGWTFDISNTYGQNDFHYFATDTVNISMGEDSPSRFDSGKLSFAQDTFNIDWSNGKTPADAGKLSFGLEYRFERYRIIAGEPASYIHGGVPVLDGPNAGAQTQAGAQVFPGFTPDNALTATHHSYAAYTDYERELTKDWSLQGALRYEYHSDFGSTSDYKLATLVRLTDRWRFRASASTGFRAPSLPQQNFTSTALSFIDNQLVSLGTYSVDAPVSRALGAKPLKPETSQHFDMGLSYRATDNLLFELDLFNIDIDNRIGLSGNISRDSNSFSDEVVAILNQYQVANIRFFTNAIDTRTQGADFSIRYSRALSNGDNLQLQFKYHYNTTELVGPIKTPGPLGNNPDVIFNRTENVRLTQRKPNNNLNLTLNYRFGNADVTVSALRFGSVHTVFYNDRPEDDQTLAAKWLLDLNLGYRLNKHWSLMLGAQNLFDTFPDYDRTFADNPFYGAGQIFQYSDSSPFGLNGGTFYLRSVYRF